MKMNATYLKPNSSQRPSGYEAATGSSKTSSGFTLVEMLVVIAIIGILVGLTLPAIRNAIETARTGAVRAEITALVSAIDQYNQTHGDYPPDFTSNAVVTRHYNKLFPRMGAIDRGLLTDLISAGDMSQAEVLFWCLGGYSDDKQRPFTGPGGPLELTGSDATDLSNYRANQDRPNKLYDFKPGRLVTSDDDDIHPMYIIIEEGGPFVYFDSRTYGNPNNSFSGTGHGMARPYISDQANVNTGGNYPSLQASLAAWNFMKPDTFQLIAPGLDGGFGRGPSTTTRTVYFQYPTGRAIEPSTSVDNAQDLLVVGVSRFSETSIGGENLHADNLTNFADSRLIDDLRE